MSEYVNVSVSVCVHVIIHMRVHACECVYHGKEKEMDSFIFIDIFHQ